MSTETVHATTVAVRDRGVMILGPSGAGKSDLALRLIDRGAMLVSDDYTILTHDGAALIASAPATIAGRMEVRGIGVVERPYHPAIGVALVVVLGDEGERMPDPLTVSLAGVDLPAVAIDPRHASAPIKVEWALDRVAP